MELEQEIPRHVYIEKIKGMNERCNQQIKVYEQTENEIESIKREIESREIQSDRL